MDAEKDADWRTRSTTGSIPGSQMKLENVQLRVVGEDLIAVQEIKCKLYLSCTCEGESCRIFFNEEGKSNILVAFTRIIIDYRDML